MVDTTNEKTPGKQDKVEKPKKAKESLRKQIETNSRMLQEQKLEDAVVKTFGTKTTTD